MTRILSEGRAQKPGYGVVAENIRGFRRERKWQKVWEGGGRRTLEGTESQDASALQMLTRQESHYTNFTYVCRGQNRCCFLFISKLKKIQMTFIAEDTWQPQSSPQGARLNYKCIIKLADLEQLLFLKYFPVFPGTYISSYVLWIFQLYALSVHRHRHSGSLKVWHLPTKGVTGVGARDA